MEAVLEVVILPTTPTNVAETVSVQNQHEKLESHHCLFKVISTVLLPAHQVLPLRGHGYECDSKFLQLLKLRGEDDPRVEVWLKKKTDIHISKYSQ